MPDRQLSATIGIARVLCILGIVYVHSWTGLDGHRLAQAGGTAQGLLRWILIDLLGRGAVPLLGMVSGWLVAPSIARQGPRMFLAGRARTILAPMVLWNLIAMVLVSGAAWAGLVRAPVPADWWWPIDELLCLATPNDINVQMSFLRDLFVCMAMAVLLVRLPGWALGLVALTAAAWTISGIAFPLLIRPAILLFFVLGMITRRRDLAAWAAARPLLPTAIVYLLLAAVRIRLELLGLDHAGRHAASLATFDLAMRLATAMFFWQGAARMSGTAAGAALLRVEPYVFLMFCAHLVMIWLGGPFIGRLTGPLGSPAYPAYLLVQPLLVVTATLGLGRMLRAIAPAAAGLLSGGRLRQPTPGRARAAAGWCPERDSNSRPAV